MPNYGNSACRLMHRCILHTDYPTLILYMRNTVTEIFYITISPIARYAIARFAVASFSDLLHLALKLRNLYSTRLRYSEFTQAWRNEFRGGGTRPWGPLRKKGRKV